MTTFRTLISIAALAIVSLPAFSQTPATCNTATVPVCSQAVGLVDVKIKPQAAPTSLAVVGAADAYIKEVSVTNTTGSAITFTLADRQGSPIAELSAISVPANGVYVIVYVVPYWCPGGFTVIAGGAGLNYFVAWQQ